MTRFNIRQRQQQQGSACPSPVPGTTATHGARELADKTRHTLRSVPYKSCAVLCSRQLQVLLVAFAFAAAVLIALLYVALFDAVTCQLPPPPPQHKSNSNSSTAATAQARCARTHVTVQLAISSYFGSTDDYVHTAVINNKALLSMADYTSGLQLWQPQHLRATGPSYNNMTLHNGQGEQAHTEQQQLQLLHSATHDELTTLLYMREYYMHLTDDDVERFVQAMTSTPLSSSSSRPRRPLIVYLSTEAVASFVRRCLIQQRHRLLPPHTSPRQQQQQQQQPSYTAKATTTTTRWHGDDVAVAAVPPPPPRKFILVTGCTDSFASLSFRLYNNVAPVAHMRRDLLEHPLLQHWYGQNANIRHRKFTALPIGLDYHTAVRHAAPHVAATRRGAGRQEATLLQQLLPLLDVAALLPSSARVQHVNGTPQWSEAVLANVMTAAARDGNAGKDDDVPQQRSRVYTNASPTTRASAATPLCALRWTTLSQLATAPELTALPTRLGSTNATRASPVHVHVGIIVEPLRLPCFDDDDDDDDEGDDASGDNKSNQQQREGGGRRRLRCRRASERAELLSRVAVGVPCSDDNGTAGTADTTTGRRTQLQHRGSQQQQQHRNSSYGVVPVHAHVYLTVPAAILRALHNRPYGDVRRTPRVLLSFAPPTIFQRNHHTRRHATYAFLQSHMHDLAARAARRRTALWSQLREFAFVASPAGVGYDCHRTWEALLLGCIPIVLHPDVVFADGDDALVSAHDAHVGVTETAETRERTTTPTTPTTTTDAAAAALALFDDLPVIVVRDFAAEVTAASLSRWREEVYANYTQGRYKLEKLFTQHWLDHMATTTTRWSRRDAAAAAAADGGAASGAGAEQDEVNDAEAGDEAAATTRDGVRHR